MSSTHRATLRRLPGASFSTKDAMAIGKAGYTAMLSVLALEHGGLTPQRGDILVTGANGGVGSSAIAIAIAILSDLGCRVVASTGRLEEKDYWGSLGATEVIDRRTLSETGAPLASERWAGAVDSVGSRTLVNVLAQTRYRGVVTACGLAQGMDLPAPVLPFILRNVTLAGIDSVNAPHEARIEVWSRLAIDLDLSKLARTSEVVGLADVPDVAARMFEGKVRGRTVVDVNARRGPRQDRCPWAWRPWPTIRVPAKGAVVCGPGASRSGACRTRAGAFDLIRDAISSR